MSKSSENGNVLFLILIAVALFAALTWVITESTRSGSGSVQQEDMIMRFNQVQSQITNIRTALMYMRSRGISTENLNFEYDGFAENYSNPKCTADRCKVFHSGGGSAIWAKPPSQINDGTDYYITGYNQVQGVGITNLADTAATELMVVLPNITEDTCRLINAKMGLYIFTPPPEDTGTCVYNPSAPDYLYKGTLVGGNVVEATDGSLNNVFERCVRCSNGIYHYYNVLLSH
jgi:hypothetical protein